jgi:hypothetical protein
MGRQQYNLGYDNRGGDHDAYRKPPVKRKQHHGTFKGRPFVWETRDNRRRWYSFDGGQTFYPDKEYAFGQRFGHDYEEEKEGQD